MNAICCRPPRAVSPVSVVFERLLSDPFLSEWPARSEGVPASMPVDVSDDGKSVIVRATLPGFTKDQIEATVHDGVLTIVAQKADEAAGEGTGESGEKFYRRERRVGSVARRFALPVPVLEKDAQAELRDGVLTLRLAKVQPEQPHRIRVS